jgi:2-polyprenyl-3-methyl-5-hydroxy-6-metoxy-1,4-benzoquinol methylase
MIFEKDYYIDSKVSNYVNYNEKKFDPLAEDIEEELELNIDSQILDFGGATGQLIYALKKQGIENVVATDISFWAVGWGRDNLGLSSKELQHYNRQLLEKDWDYVFMLDVLEHIKVEEIKNLLGIIKCNDLLIRIPVSLKEGETFALEVSRKDKSHIQCHTKEWWNNIFTEYGYKEYDIVNKDNIYESDGVLSRVYRRV